MDLTCKSVNSPFNACVAAATRDKKDEEEEEEDGEGGCLSGCCLRQPCDESCQFNQARHCNHSLVNCNEEKPPVLKAIIINILGHLYYSNTVDKTKFGSDSQKTTRSRRPHKIHLVLFLRCKSQ